MPANNYELTFDTTRGVFIFYHKSNVKDRENEAATAAAIASANGLDPPRAAAAAAPPPPAPRDREKQGWQVFGTVDINTLIKILNPADLRNASAIFRVLLDKAKLIKHNCNPYGDMPNKCKYFKLIQEIIVYLDMLKDKFPASKLRALNLFPTLEKLVGIGGVWPQYSSSDHKTELHAIESVVYSKIADSIETKYWKKGEQKRKKKNV